MTDKPFSQYRDSSSSDLLEVFWRRKFIIIICAVVMAIASYLASVYFVTSIFRSRTNILVREERLNPGDAFPQFDANVQYSVSQAEILKGERNINAAIAKIIAGDQKNGASKKLNSLVDEAYIKKGLAAVTAWVIGGTNIVELNVEHEDPYVAAALANAMSEIYVEERVASKERVVTDVIESHRAEVEQAAKDVLQAEKELLTYVDAEKVVLLVGTDIALDLGRYARFDEMLVAVDSDIEKTRTQLTEMKKALTNPSQATVPAVGNSPVVRDLKSLIRAAETKRDDLLANYTAGHPLVVSVQGEISRLGTELENERNKITIAEIKALELEYNALQSKREVVAAEQKQHAKRFDEVLLKQPRLAQLQYEIDSKRLIYRDLLKEQQNLGIVKARSIQMAEAEIIQSATVPEKPINSDVAKNIVFGAMFGFTLGCAIVLLTAGAPAKQQPQAEAEQRKESERRSRERRGAPRNEAFYDVSYAKLGEQRTCQTSDISASGMRIVTEEAMNKGTVLDFQINRPDMRPLAGKGSIVWTSPAQVNGKQGFYVAGLKFGDQPPNTDKT